MRRGSQDARRRLLVGTVGVVLGVLLLFGLTSGFYIDLLWFREVGFEDAFWTMLRTKLGLGLAFGLAFFAILYVNLVFVRRLTPAYRVLTPEQEMLERYRLALEPYLSWLIPAIAGVLALFVAIGAATKWQTFLLWRNGSGLSFGVKDPQFGRDVAYYVFAQPWLTFVQGWLFASLVGVTLLTGIGHYLWGNIRPQGPGEKVTPQVKAHLSVLIGLVVFVKAWGYWLERFDLLVSPRGVVTGASYTDVNAQLPALTLLLFIAIGCGVLFLVNIRNRGWALPILGIGLLALASIVVGTIYPAVIQRFRVDPQEFQLEVPYIARNIESTRRAFGLDGVTLTSRDVALTVRPEEIAQNEITIANVRLWRPEVLRDTLKALQRIRQYYEFNDVDVDRYTIAGERRVVMVAAREVSQDGIPAGGGTWQNRHLVYTHGYGAVATQVNTATPEGAPVFTLRDIPPLGEPALAEGQPRVYFGEAEDVPFVIVNSGTEELDFEGATTSPEYTGRGGIEVGSLVRRAMFALRYRDPNLLISSLIDDDSRILIHRDIGVRVPKVAPFLTYDGDPYVAIVDERIVWIWDAYTMSDRYPYSQEADLGVATGDLLAGEANYIRNSVKVVVDAYDGTMTYYVADEADPIIRAWQGAFPGMFTPIDRAPAVLLEHFRYPENLFQVQAAQYANYHLTPDEAQIFYRKQEFWAVPKDPTIGDDSALRPYYLLMRLPGETEEEFVLVLPFTPTERQNMVAWMAAKSDPDGYGEIVAYEFPLGRNIDGPTQAFARINQDPEFSAQRSLLGQEGSLIRFGDLLVIPIGESVLYVQPMYIESDQPNAIPELKRVIVVNGESVGVGETFAEALSAALGAEIPEPDGEGEPSGTVSQRVAALVDEALEHFAAADEALQEGDLARYQAEIEAAREAIERANELASRKGEEPPVEPTPEATPSPEETP